MAEIGDRSESVEWAVQVMSLGAWVDDFVFSEDAKVYEWQSYTSAEERARVNFKNHLPGWPDVKRRIVRRVISEEVMEVYADVRPYDPPKLITKDSDA